MSPPAPPPEDTEHGPPTTAGPLRVLVVEDNPVNALMATTMLERLGHEARAVATGARALDALAEGGYDLVLMDLQEPETDGLETTRRLREIGLEAGRCVRILGVTGKGEVDREAAGRAAGVDRVVPRPLTLETLAAALAGEPRPALDRHRLAVQLGGDPEAVQGVLRDFLVEGPASLSRLREAVAAGDARNAEQAAHRLKGALRWIAADVAAASAEAVESRARSGDLSFPAGQLDDLVGKVERTLEEARTPVDAPRGLSAFGTAAPEDD